MFVISRCTSWKRCEYNSLYRFKFIFGYYRLFVFRFSFFYHLRKYIQKFGLSLLYNLYLTDIFLLIQLKLFRPRQSLLKCKQISFTLTLSKTLFIINLSTNNLLRAFLGAKWLHCRVCTYRISPIHPSVIYKPDFNTLGLSRRYVKTGSEPWVTTSGVSPRPLS